MATSKKRDRIKKLIHLHKALAGGVKGPTNTSGITVTFPLAAHKANVEQVRQMLAEEGIFLMTDLGVDS